MKPVPRHDLVSLSSGRRRSLRGGILAGTAVLLFFSIRGMRGEIQRDHFESSLICGSCHSEIYEEWKASSHAVSWEDSLFQDVYAAVQSRGGSSKCLSCHAPVAWKNSDRMVMDRISREGVSCDYCHTLFSGNSPASSPSFRSRIGREQVGRTGAGRSIYHGIKGGEEFGGVEYCA